MSWVIPGNDVGPITWPTPELLPSALPGVEVFDVNLLPDALLDWIVDIAERLQCPADYPAVAAIIALAGIVGRKIGLRPQRRIDWQVVPNLWGAVIGRPGLMKTPAIQEPLDILKRLEADAKSEYETAMREHKAALIVAKATRDVRQSDLKQAIKAGKGADEIAAELQSLEPSEPIRRRHLINDSTVEKLGELLNQNPNGLTVFRDELIGLLKSLDQEGREGARAFFLEAWNGSGRFTYDRIARGTLDIVATIVSIIGAIQPGPLSDYVRKLAKGGAGDDGLIQRFQLAVWPDCPKTWRNVDRFPDSNARRKAHATYVRLDQMQPVELAAEVDEQEAVPFLRFDDEAQDRFDTWRGELESRLRSGAEHPAVESHLAKYRSLVPSLALLIHLADEPDGGPVTVAALKRAVGWSQYLETHARRIYGALERHATNSARTLAGKILDGSLTDGFSLRDVYRPGWSGLSDRNEASAAVEVLLDHDWLQSESLPTCGRNKTVFWINPRVFTDLPETY